MNPYESPNIPSEPPADKTSWERHRPRLISAAAFAVVGWLLCLRAIAEMPAITVVALKLVIVLSAAACGYAVCAMLQELFSWRDPSSDSP